MKIISTLLKGRVLLISLLVGQIFVGSCFPAEWNEINGLDTAIRKEHFLNKMYDSVANSVGSVKNSIAEAVPVTVSSATKTVTKHPFVKSHPIPAGITAVLSIAATAGVVYGTGYYVSTLLDLRRISRQIERFKLDVNLENATEGRALVYNDYKIKKCSYSTSLLMELDQADKKIICDDLIRKHKSVGQINGLIAQDKAYLAGIKTVLAPYLTNPLRRLEYVYWGFDKDILIKNECKKYDNEVKTTAHFTLSNTSSSLLPYVQAARTNSFVQGIWTRFENKRLNPGEEEKLDEIVDRVMNGKTLRCASILFLRSNYSKAVKLHWELLKVQKRLDALENVVKENLCSHCNKFKPNGLATICTCRNRR